MTTQSDSVPTVSVLMSIYDGVSAMEVEAAIRSIQSQTLVDFELLIMQDDVRRDDLRALLRRLAEGDLRIRLFDADVRRGLAAAMNRLIDEARAPYLARMDADDVSYPDRFARQAAFLDANPDVMLLGTMTREIDAEGRTVFEKSLPTRDVDIRAMQCYRDPFVHPAVMFRRRVFDLIGRYSEQSGTRLLEDTELWSRALLAGLKTANLPEFLYGFRVNDGLYARRGGVALAFRELKLRWSYVRRAGFSIIHYLPALVVAAMRLGPTSLRRRLYQWCRK